MSGPEEIPEDKKESHPCDCGGNITLDETEDFWECDSCEASFPNKC
jgi:ribosomal protein L37AE/L43A